MKQAAHCPACIRDTVEAADLAAIQPRPAIQLEERGCRSAPDAYVNAHGGYYNALHTWEGWYTSFFFDRGEADARRAKACH